ncbi:MAG: Gfo/Idh/MocA family oxidoreductase [Acidobacteriota bacterium]
MKITLIGCGRDAHPYAVSIGNHPAMELVSVVDSNPEKARSFGASFNCLYYTSLDEYLSGNQIADCSVVCTPPENNADIVTRLMERGYSVLCENPFALDSASAEKMTELSGAVGVQLMAGSRFRYLTDIIHSRGLIQSGILGRILVFEIDFRDFADTDIYANFWMDRGTHGALTNRGNHAIDIARYFFGPLLRIRAEATPNPRTSQFKGNVRLDMRTVSGVIGTAQLSCNIKSTREDYIRIYGTQGTLCVGWNTSVYRLNGFADWTEFGEGYSTQKAITRQMENLLHAIKRKGIPETTAEDGCESARAIEAAYQSLSSRQWINVVSRTTPKRIERNFRVLRPA